MSQRASVAAWLACMCVPAWAAARADPWISNGPKVYATARSGLDCAKTSNVKQRLEEQEQGSFWEDAAAGNSIYFNRQTWVLSVCSSGRPVAARMDEGPGGGFLVTVQTPFFQDVNGDGRPEFMVWYGQCLEGPCVGEHMVLQVDGKRIQRLVSMRAERLDVIQEDGHEAFLLTRYCFTREWGIGYEYFAFVVFGPRGTLVLVPTRDLKDRFPRTMTQVVQGIRESAARAPPSADREVNKDIQGLVLDAYNGKTEKDLTVQYARMAPAPDGTSCEALDVLRAVVH